jgi:hypothetical protein
VTILQVGYKTGVVQAIYVLLFSVTFFVCVQLRLLFTLLLSAIYVVANKVKKGQEEPKLLVDEETDATKPDLHSET